MLSTVTILVFQHHLWIHGRVFLEPEADFRAHPLQRKVGIVAPVPDDLRVLASNVGRIRFQNGERQV